MNRLDTNDYLWDRTGERDPLVADLERRLAPLRAESQRKAGARAPRRTPIQLILLAAAAALVAAPLLFLTIASNDKKNAGGGAGGAYEVTLLDGAGRVGGAPVKFNQFELAAGEARAFAVGSLLTCDPGARARIRIVGKGELVNVGEATLEGPCAVRLDRSSAEMEKLYLFRGKLSARIAANVRPRLFQVETPSGTAVDLGCVYTMHVNETGETELAVSVGRVAFEIAQKTVFVWSGARCAARRDGTVTTPVDDGSARAFRDAVDHYHRSGDPASLDAILTHARLRDAASLWHLLQIPDAAAREKVYDRLAALSPPPPDITKEAALRGDPPALERWRVDLMGW